METHNENYLSDLAYLYAVKKNDYARRYGKEWFLDGNVKKLFDEEIRKVTKNIRK